MSYTNADGLYVLTHGGQGVVQDKGTALNSTKRMLVVDIPDFTAIGSTFGASDIDPNDPVIPAGAVITNADLIVTTAATSGGSATLTIGTYNAAGSAIVAAGIDSAIALTAIDADNDVVQCDGTQVAGVIRINSNAYVGLIYGTAAFTAGAGKLVIEYYLVD